MANMSSPRQASWPSTVALTLARPTGPCTAMISASRVSVSPGLQTRLKRTLSMPANRPTLSPPGAASADGGTSPARRGLGSGARGGDGRRLGERLDDEHAGHDRVAGEVPGEPPVVVPERADGHAAHARLAVDDLVDEQKRRAVRQQLEHLLVRELHSGFSSLVRRR